MSMHDDGSGVRAAPAPRSQSDFASSQTISRAPDDASWSINLNATSEVPCMSSGPGRPGQPIMGQRPMFGGGSPAFARMPSYTPVTRGYDQGPQPQPEPPQPAPYPQSGAAPYPATNPAPAPSYPRSNGNNGMAPAYPSQSYPSPSYPNQSYPSQSQPAQSYPAEGYPSQGYPAQNYSNQGYQGDATRDGRFADASFPETSFAEGSAGDASFPETGYREDASFSENGFSDANHAADASFPEEASYAPNADYGHEEPLNLEAPNGGYPQAYHPLNDQALHVAMASRGGQARANGADPHRAVATFDALYDQPPQIALGSPEQARHGAAGFYEGERPDADFLDDGQAAGADMVAAQAGRKLTVKGRSIFMVGSALLGAVALGGALAYAYKQSGGAMNGTPPLVQADNRPVKEAPEQAGAKDFPHKNKLIYDRLETGDKPEADHLVPRQEDVAVPAMPAPTNTAGLTAPGPQTTEAMPPVPASAVATVDDPDGGPRRVKTLVVRPDGSVMPPAGVAAAAAAAPAAAAPVQMAAAVAPAPAAAQPRATDTSEPQQVASIQPQPAPAPKPKAVVKASVGGDDAAPAARASSAFVVQVGSKKNQTDALATFADMQQKYPTLLANYRPMVQKADLGAKGVWYRLRIGPINDKTAASKLCTQLKSQGMSDCLVMTE